MNLIILKNSKFLYCLFDNFKNRCGDNIDYGYRFSRDFVDTPESEINPTIIDSSVSFINTNQTKSQERKRKPRRNGRIRREMNIHNNEVGRRVNRNVIKISYSTGHLFILRLFIN